jgi:hypothetical protein
MMGRRQGALGMGERKRGEARGGATSVTWMAAWEIMAALAARVQREGDAEEQRRARQLSAETEGAITRGRWGDMLRVYRDWIALDRRVAVRRLRAGGR